MKRILVPIDFSAPSRASFTFAIDLAARAHANIYAVHMVELPLLAETTFGVQPYVLDPHLLHDAINRSNTLFDQIKKQIPTDVTVNFENVNNYVVPGILSYIDKYKIDLIVMGTRSTTGLQGFLMGSAAEKIVRFSPVPVITIPHDVTTDSIKDIVLPHTLELDQKDLITDLKALQQLLHARLHILLINTPLNFQDERQARKKLERFAGHYKLHDFTFNLRSHQSESGGILEFMDEIKGDMIAMSTNGRTGLAHFLKGSIAEAILNKIDHPIWTSRIKKKALA
jgi:nucleotide-binding universal stress UspA family protein